jgi:hypothetical protein
LTLEFITSLSNVLTLGLLLTGAIAAVVQFGHVRAGNELAAVLAIDRSFAQPELQAALVYVQDELPTKLALPQYRSVLAARGYVDTRDHPEMAVCNWFNEMGMLVAGKFVNEDLFLDSYGRLAEYYWRLLGPVIALLRRERGSGQYANFELLAQHAEHWRERHRGGIYPTGQPRLRVIDRWASIDGHGAGSA